MFLYIADFVTSHPVILVQKNTCLKIRQNTFVKQIANYTK